MRKDRLVATAFGLILTATMLLTIIPIGNGQVPTRKTVAEMSIAPHLSGLGQQLTVIIWVQPQPATLHFNWYAEAFEGLTVSFTRPDGTKDTFMPTDASGGLKPGQAELVGAIWFYYTPNQVGTWSVKFNFPGGTLGTGSEAVYYEPAESPSTTFTVQKDPVNAGVLNGWPYVALPTGYWTWPVNSDNREWYQISGDWLQSRCDGYASYFNPYAQAPVSPHILWKRQVQQGGLVGGAWGSLSYESTGGNPPIIMMGRAFYNQPGGVFHCVNLYTGQLVYEKPGTVTLGQNLRATSRAAYTVETQGAVVSPSLWELGSATSTTWKRYDPLTGALLQTISNVPASPLNWDPTRAATFTTRWYEGDPTVYVIRQGGYNTTIPFRLAVNELIKWDYTKVTGNNWTTGIVWRTSMKQADGSGPGEGQRGSNMLISADRTVGMVATTEEDVFYGFDLNTGKQIWTKKVDFEQIYGALYGFQDGIYVTGDSVTKKMYGFDIATGNQLWTSDPIGEYPWGSQQIICGFAYGNTYILSYDGYVYALNYKTGKLTWKSQIGEPTTETVFNNYVPYMNPAIADGKIYFPTSEHSPTQPRIRGNKLFCIDAYTGKEIWNLSSAIGTAYGGSSAIADGIWIGTSENDGKMYAIGKGQTSTTVSVSSKVVAKGSSVLIEGTVKDLSPAQPDTPAVSDASMSEWMDYLHMQKPMPTNVRGVPIGLMAIGPDGSTIELGSVNGDGGGLFKKMWTPTVEGEYTIIATFAGSNSYWGSMAETALGVTGAAASASPSPTGSVAPTGAEAVSAALYIGVASIVIVIIVVVVALVLRRRK